MKFKLALEGMQLVGVEKNPILKIDLNEVTFHWFSIHQTRDPYDTELLVWREREGNMQTKDEADTDRQTKRQRETQT